FGAGDSAGGGPFSVGGGETMLTAYERIRGSRFAGLPKPSAATRTRTISACSDSDPAAASHIRPPRPSCSRLPPPPPTIYPPPRHYLPPPRVATPRARPPGGPVGRLHRPQPLHPPPVRHPLVGPEVDVAGASRAHRLGEAAGELLPLHRLLADVDGTLPVDG